MLLMRTAVNAVDPNKSYGRSSLINLNYILWDSSNDVIDQSGSNDLKLIITFNESTASSEFKTPKYLGKADKYSTFDDYRNVYWDPDQQQLQYGQFYDILKRLDKQQINFWSSKLRTALGSVMAYTADDIKDRIKMMMLRAGRNFYAKLWRSRKEHSKTEPCQTYPPSSLEFDDFMRDDFVNAQPELSDLFMFVSIRGILREMEYFDEALNNKIRQAEKKAMIVVGEVEVKLDNDTECVLEIKRMFDYLELSERLKLHSEPEKPPGSIFDCLMLMQNCIEKKLGLRIHLECDKRVFQMYKKY